MAADVLSVRANRMKDSSLGIGETSSEYGDIDLPETIDHVCETDSGFIEDRFRVDRKKLEQMLQAQSENEAETAEDFFQRIMDETNTQITWPSKLKIGAKSKKDPHIKVTGYTDDVRMAKEKVMALLDTKGNRVTLKMDVSHTDHSHVIGKGGNNIKRVMQDTGCHIHFPDSNRGNNIQEKSNQVSIAGMASGVESARSAIRDLLPLVFTFELPTVPQAVPDPSSPAIQKLQQTYNVQISFKQRPRMYVTTVVVRGSVNNAEMVKEATSRLVEQLAGNISPKLPVSMQLEIAPQHHLFIIGRGGMNIKQIMQRTGASIHFPDPNTVSPQRKGTVYITGTIESVFLARRQLIGCLPLVLMFDVKDNIDMEPVQITQLMEQLDVYISVKPKPKQPSKSVIVKSIERNAPNMYLARLILLGLEKSDGNYPAINSAINTSETVSMVNNFGVTALGLFGNGLLSLNATNSLLMINGQNPSLGSPPSNQHLANLNSPGSHQPAVVTDDSPWMSQTQAGIFTPLVVVPPSVTPCKIQNLQSPPDLLSHHDCQPHDVHKNNQLPQPIVRVDPVMRNAFSERNSPCHSPCNNNNSNSILKPCSANLSSSPQSPGGLDEMVTRDRTPSPSSSGHTLDLLGLSKITAPQSQMPPLSALVNKESYFVDSILHGQLQAEDAAVESGAESDSSDIRAPGRERKGSNSSSTSSLFQSPLLPFAIDYEEKKLLATKAMQKKPFGESRIPTDFWAGLGFSKSMPESAIREKLSQSGHGICDPDMTAAFEANCTEYNSDVDRDPWKVCPHPVNSPLNKAPGEYPRPRKKCEYGLSNSNHIDSASLPPKSLWSSKTDLAELFSKLGLGKYTELFQQQEIDLSTFLTLTDRDLRELGISTFGARRKMLLAIADLNKRRTLLMANNRINNPFQENGASGLHTQCSDMGIMSRRW